MELNFNGSIFFVKFEIEGAVEDLQLIGHLMGADFIAGVEVDILNIRADVKVPGSCGVTQAMNWLIGLDGPY